MVAGFASPRQQPPLSRVPEAVCCLPRSAPPE